MFEADNTSAIGKFNFKAVNVAIAWKQWKEQFKMFLRASKLEEETDSRKVALILHYMGPESFNIARSFNVNFDNIRYVDLLSKFDGYFVPKVNVAMERHKFFSRKQLSEESLEAYVTILKNLSLSCDFGDLRESLVKDIFICGMSPKYQHIKERLLSEDKIGLERAVEISRNIEIVRENANQLANGNNNQELSINALKQTDKQKICRKCGHKHQNKCPAYDAVCHSCNKKGHYAKMCFSKQKQQQQHNQQHSNQKSKNGPKFVKHVHREEDLSDQLFVGTISISNTGCQQHILEQEKQSKINIFENKSIKNNLMKHSGINQLTTVQNKICQRGWMVQVIINNKQVVCQVDTGADTNILSKRMADELSLSKEHLQETKVKYNPKNHDPESKRIDGAGRCYPNCDSTVWLRSCEKEIIEPIEGHVIGKIPNWLSGSLLRNGPGNWQVGDMTFQHLFDCSALLHRFAIHNGHVTYQNRFVQTETLKKNNAAQRIVVTEFGTASVPDLCHSIFDKVSAIFRPDSGSDNCMISIYPFGDEFYTFTESPIIHRINPRTLATEERLIMTDYVGIVSHTSHPHVMPNGTIYNLGMATTKSGPAYSIICFPHGENMFENAYVKAHVPCRWKLHPSYMHTFGITENYFVIVEQPLSISLTEFVKAHICNQNLSACLKWFEDKPTLFHLVDRKSGEVTHTFESEAFFFLHIINQYEENNCVVIDICCYKDPEMINCMYLESIINMQSNPNYASLFRGRPLRFVLPLGTATDFTLKNAQHASRRSRLLKSLTFSNISSRLQQPKMKHSQSQHEDITFMTTNIRMKNQSTNDLLYNNNDMTADSKESIKYEALVNLINLPNSRAEAYEMPNHQIFVRPELLCDWGCETPRINYENHLAKKYQYFYAISSDVDADNPGTLVKVDVINKSCKKWCEEHCYPSEPIFVPSPGAKDEDDGVVLASLVWGGFNENKVGLLVLCAKTWNEIGRCIFHTNGPVPKCLHGWYAKDVV